MHGVGRTWWVHINDSRRPAVGDVVETCGIDPDGNGDVRTFYRKYMKDRCSAAPFGRWSEACATIKEAQEASRPHRRMSSMPSFWRPV